MTPELLRQPNPPTGGPANGRRNETDGRTHALAAPPADGHSASRPPRVVVADGDPAACQLHQEALSRLGCQVCAAHSGRQLLEQCRLLRPDLVVAAVTLPDLNGVAAAEAVCREQPVPVILLPTEQDAEAARRALDNPYVFACLFRPVKEADLQLAVALAVSRFGQFESARKEAADLRQTLEERKLIERAKGLVMRYSGLDEREAYRRLRRLASDQNRKLVEVAQAVLTAGEVFHQLEQAPEGERMSVGPLPKRHKSPGH